MIKLNDSYVPSVGNELIFSALMLPSTPIWWSEEGDSGSLVTGAHRPRLMRGDVVLSDGARRSSGVYA
jgi:hypothetical protein